MSRLRHTNVAMMMGACMAPPALLLEHCSRRSVDKLLAAAARDPQARSVRCSSCACAGAGASAGLGRAGV